MPSGIALSPPMIETLSCTVGATIAREHLWLLSPPVPTMHVWRVTCVEALNAMDACRRYMWAVHCAHPTPGLPAGQTVLPYAPVGPAPVGAHAGGRHGGRWLPSMPTCTALCMRTTRPLRTWPQWGRRMRSCAF
eukprot:365970-Chlamydomonas_euryale.AAC.13